MHVYMLLSGLALGADLPFSTAGCDQLSTLSELRFTFNVEVSGEHKTERRWEYHPRSSKVVRTVDGESMTFTFGSPKGEAETEADAQFVNDSFWLLPSCHMAWAKDIVISPVGEGTIPVAPVGEAPGRARMVTVTYPEDGGGYTPGDAYDLYLGANGEIVAWSYRRKAAAEPTLSTTFDDYVSAGPLRIATEHASSDRDFRLFFTDVVVQR